MSQGRFQTDVLDVQSSEQISMVPPYDQRQKQPLIPSKSLKLQEFVEKPLQLGDLNVGEQQNDCISNCYRCCLLCSGCCAKILCCFFAFCRCGPVKIIRQGYHGVLKQFGKFKSIKGPGLYVYNPCTEEIQEIDTRIFNQEIQSQNIMTNDFVNIQLSTVIYWKIIEPYKALFKVSKLPNAMSNITRGAIKKVIAKFELQTILDQRNLIDQALKEILVRKCDLFGVQIVGIEIKFISLPQTMQHAMAVVAEAQKEKESKIIQALGNKDAATIMHQAANEMSKNPMTVQLHYFEILKMISKEKSETYIVPDSFIKLFKQTQMAQAFKP